MSLPQVPNAPNQTDGPVDSLIVTDRDIDRAVLLLKLPQDSFGPYDGGSARREVLKSMQRLDVAACPGSGKTTVLVTKLAALAEKWPYRTRGICALSHTNVARREIETRLCSTMVGRRLVAFPHYVGTIHGFVNQFLAIPWLRSQGYPIKFIDSDICERKRWTNLPYGTRKYLENKNLDKSAFRIIDPDFNLQKKTGELPFGTQAETYEHLRSACQKGALAGYHCFDDMFVWATAALEKMPSLGEVIRDRFPVLLIDEAQDNSEQQSEILHRIFQHGCGPVVCQRFGDENQAIFDTSFGSSEATTNKFPSETVRKDLPDSHRFGQKIADLANPLGLVTQNLNGRGPKDNLLVDGLGEAKHTIFIFNEDSATEVLDAYGQLLLSTFSTYGTKQGTFVAAGQVHTTPVSSSPQQFPHHVGNYWPQYRPELASKEPRPKSFVECVGAGASALRTSGEAHSCVNKIADAILQLSRLLDQSNKVLRCNANHHRYVLKLVAGTDAHEPYIDLTASFTTGDQVLTRESWHTKWKSVALEIAKAISKTEVPNIETENYLEWKEPSSNHPASLTVEKKSVDNEYTYSQGERTVAIRVGSIHSAKGETHAAMLVLETYWYAHNLADLLPWLCGEKIGGATANKRQKTRLKVHYVAMTRPTHLLCLAMHRRNFIGENGNLDQDRVKKLLNRGWQVVEI
ncbi:MAG: UvrD/REP helicase [Candidatus Acidoferrum typicum]|nr:UvrD/REP helicase [Candidatus Acidoferrum typicum]